jgi:hypothetical protein
LRRNDEAFLNGLGAQRIPDPTTSGDFTRRFDQDSLLMLIEAINATRQQVWEKQPEDFLSQAFIDIDGTIAGTLGECKGGMALSYKGIWGYAPLIITLADTREVLYLVNRPGNVVSHQGCVPWIDRAIELVRPRAGEITLRGDTDFTLSAELDRWDGQGIKLIVALANGRCDQENVIEQLKNGVNAMRMPVDDLLSNWAYMVMSALAWNLKAWYGLLMPNRERGLELLRMEFRRFLHLIVMLPAQIVRSGRRIIYRIMGYNDWLESLLPGSIFAVWRLPNTGPFHNVGCHQRNDREFQRRVLP